MLNGQCVLHSCSINAFTAWGFSFGNVWWVILLLAFFSWWTLEQEPCNIQDLIALFALPLASLYFGNILFVECSGLDKCSFCHVWHKPCHHASIAIGDALGVVYIALGIWASWVLTLALNTIYRPIACLCSMKVILRHVYVRLVLINDLMLSPVLKEGFIYHPPLTTCYYEPWLCLRDWKHPWFFLIHLISCQLV